MKTTLTVMLAIIFIVIIEVLIYLFFAFCCWGLNWPPNSHSAIRVFFSFIAILGLFGGAIVSINVMEDQYIDKN